MISLHPYIIRVKPHTTFKTLQTNKHLEIQLNYVQRGILRWEAMRRLNIRHLIEYILSGQDGYQLLSNSNLFWWVKT